MINYEAILEKIMKERREQLTTHELLESGLTDYYIRKLMTLGELSRVERGLYQVNRVKKKIHSSQSIQAKKNKDVSQKTTHYYERFVEVFQNQDYFEALNYLKMAIHYQENHLFLNEYHSILSLYLMGEDILEEARDSQDFDSSLQAQDYLSAYRFFPKDKTDEAHLLLKEMLQLLHDKNDLLLQTSLQNQNALVQFQEEQQQNYQKSQYDNIVNAILRKDFDTAVTLLLEYEKHDELPQEFNVLKRLLLQLQKITMSHMIYSVTVDSYTQVNSFQQFFASLRNHDYEKSLSFCKDCQELILNRGDDVLPFQLYEIVLEQLNFAQKQVVEHQQKVEQFQQCRQELKHYLFDMSANQISMDSLLHCLHQMSSFVSLEEKKYVSCSISLVHAISLLQSGAITLDYFETFSYSGSLLQNFETAMSLGDYVSASKMIYEINWKKFPSWQRMYFSLYRKLFSLFHEKKKVYQVENSPMNSEVSFYRQMSRLVKKADYYGAYQIYVQHENCFSHNSQVVLDFLLQALSRNQFRIQQQYYEKMKWARSRGDYELAQTSLEALEQCKQGTSLERNTDYMHQKIKLSWKDIQEPDFVQRKQLYSWARYYYEIGDYEKSLSLIQQYIQIDEERTFYGYCFQGQIYQHLHQESLAIESYQKALGIYQAPFLYWRLGQLSQILGRKREALTYYLEWQQRAIHSTEYAIDTILELSQTLGEEALQKEYEQKRKVHLLLKAKNMNL